MAQPPISTEQETTTLHVVEYLRQNSVQKLAEEFKVIFRQHSKYPNLFLFIYDSFESYDKNPIVQECRSLILDQDDNWRVISFPYKKFYNYGEKNAATIDWQSAVVYEKLDGSLATLYWYRGEWWVASTSVPDATGVMQKDGLRFCDVFWDIWKKSGYSLPDDHNKCYMFEMLSSKNPIVVRPKKDALILHGCRDLTSLQELDPEPIAQRYQWKCVRKYPLQSLAQVIEAARNLNPFVTEGYVVRDKYFNRIKVKSPQHVALSHLSVRDQRKMNKTHILEIVRSNEGDEFLTYYPKFRPLYENMKQFYTTTVSTIETLYRHILQTVEDDTQFEGSNQNTALIEPLDATCEESNQLQHNNQTKGSMGTTHTNIENGNDVTKKNIKQKKLARFEEVAKTLTSENKQKSHLVTLLKAIYKQGTSPRTYIRTCNIKELVALYIDANEDSTAKQNTETKSAESVPTARNKTAQSQCTIPNSQLQSPKPTTNRSNPKTNISTQKKAFREIENQ